MYIVQFHNEHTANEDTIFGPFETLDDAKSYMQYIIDIENDVLFKDRTNEFKEPGCEELGYAGFDMSELEMANRDCDLASEIWVQIHLLYPPNR